MVFTKKFIILLAIICVGFICVVPAVSAAQASSEQEIFTILTVNDFHGALSENGKNPGMAKLAAVLLNEQAKNPEGTILVSAGDMFQGTPESNMLYGKPVVEAMNELKFAAMAIGNHEFDWGIQVLKERIVQSNFPYLAANIIDKTSGHIASFVKPYTVVEKNGIKIGIIGLATPETAYKTNPKYMENYIFADPAKTVNRLIPALRQQGVDIIVVLSHLGSEMNVPTQQVTGEAANLAQQVAGVNAIISGHTHLKVAGMVNSIPVIQAAYSGRAVGEISFSFAKNDRKVINIENRVIEVSPSNVVADRAVQAIVDKALREVAPVKNKVLGYSKDGLEHEKFTHSVLGQWVTDAMRHKVNAAIAFENGGGLRASIPAGNITMGNLFQVVPFDNTLVTVELTGKQVLEVLEHGVYNKQIGMIQFSGLCVEYDKSLPPNERFTRVTLSDGSNLNLAKKYKVVTNDFMAQGGDGYSMFSQGEHFLDTQIPVRDCLIEAVTKGKTMNVTIDNRFKEVVPVSNSIRPAA